MNRARTRSRKGGRIRKSSVPHDPVLDEMRNRRYLAFVRAIVGAARLRNSSR